MEEWEAPPEGSDPQPVPSLSGSQTCAYCFTLNTSFYKTLPETFKVEDSEPYKWFHTPVGHPPLRYIVFQLEVAPRTSRVHFQGFLYFQSKQRFSALKKVHPSAHFEQARHTSKSIEYCQKPESRLLGPWEFGDPPKNKSESALTTKEEMDLVYQKIQSGASEREIARDHFLLFCRYNRGIERTINFNVPQTRPYPRVLVLWGESRTGKSSFCSELQAMYPDQTYTRNVSSSGNQMFWMRCSPHHKVIFLDDFTGYIDFTEFKNLIGTLVIPLSDKGTSFYPQPHAVIITSNFSPSSWYPRELRNANNERAFWERLTAVYEMKRDCYDNPLPPILKHLNKNPQSNPLCGQEDFDPDQDPIAQIVDYKRLGNVSSEIISSFPTWSLHRSRVPPSLIYSPSTSSSTGFVNQTTSSSSSSAPPSTSPIRDIERIALSHSREPTQSLTPTQHLASTAISPLVLSSSPFLEDLTPAYGDTSCSYGGQEEAASPYAISSYSSQEYGPIILSGPTSHNNRPRQPDGSHHFSTTYGTFDATTSSDGLRSLQDDSGSGTNQRVQHPLPVLLQSQPDQVPSPLDTARHPFSECSRSPSNGFIPTFYSPSEDDHSCQNSPATSTDSGSHTGCSLDFDNMDLSTYVSCSPDVLIGGQTCSGLSSSQESSHDPVLESSCSHISLDQTEQPGSFRGLSPSRSSNGTGCLSQPSSSTGNASESATRLQRSQTGPGKFSGIRQRRLSKFPPGTDIRSFFNKHK